MESLIFFSILVQSEEVWVLTGMLAGSWGLGLVRLAAKESMQPL